MVPKPFKRYYDGKCSHSTFSMAKVKMTITQIRPDDQNKGKRKALKAKGSNFGIYTY